MANAHLFYVRMRGWLNAVARLRVHVRVRVCCIVAFTPAGTYI
jgi:hypothetical protein